ncbi:hypothetical protein [Flavobacterium sp. 9]|uniref:hypothetical protein n=1 Tax=Flavobacterium sp. 9 TaxID=2035198 RepID=UPI000C1776D7|nr:hypothetical protein [Flavobacterium sp. 9]
MVSYNSYSQKNKCIIYFKDGTTVTGLGKMKVNGDVKFKLNKDTESINYAQVLIDKIKTSEYVFLDTYKYVITTDGFSSWLKVIIEGNTTLYQREPSNYYYSGSITPITNYYVSHKGDSNIFKITSEGISTNFKKAASNFFKDCPILVEKINSKEFTKDDIEKVVKFYNNNCSNAESATTSITN